MAKKFKFGVKRGRKCLRCKKKTAPGKLLCKTCRRIMPRNTPNEILRDSEKKRYQGPTEKHTDPSFRNDSKSGKLKDDFGGKY